MARKAPEVAFRTLDGARKSLKEITAQAPALLAFYKVTCPVCQLALPFLERLRGAGAEILPVSQNSLRESQAFDRDFGTRTALLDPEEENFPASNAFRITHVPTMFLVEPDGSISWTSSGFMKKELSALGQRLGREIFRHDEEVPEAKAG